MIKFVEKKDFSGRKVAVSGTSDGDTGIEVDLMAVALKHKGLLYLGATTAKAKLFCY